MTEHIQHIRELADGLLKQSSPERESVQIRADAGMALPVFLGRSFPHGNFVARIVGVTADLLPINYRKPTLKGLIIHWGDKGGKAGGKFDIVLELANASALDIFLIFVGRICEDIESAEGRKNAVHGVLGQVDRWRNFFSGSSDNALPETRQTGLYGELMQLQSFCEEGLDAGYVFGAWTGSRRTNQDFEFGPVAVEVKSTTAKETGEFAVSNIRQLDPTGLDSLFLFRVALDVRQGGRRTLPALVESLRRRVKTDAAAHELQFEENLLRSGYRDKHAEAYSHRSYSLRFCDHYIVKGEFPRLEETDIPSGVLGVKYDVSLIGCEVFKTEYGDIVKTIGAT